jgi:hypothetical protein
LRVRIATGALPFGAAARQSTRDQKPGNQQVTVFHGTSPQKESSFKSSRIRPARFHTTTVSIDLVEFDVRSFPGTNTSHLKKQVQGLVKQVAKMIRPKQIRLGESFAFAGCSQPLATPQHAYSIGMIDIGSTESFFAPLVFGDFVASMKHVSVVQESQ